MQMSAQHCSTSVKSASKQPMSISQISTAEGSTIKVHGFITAGRRQISRLAVRCLWMLLKDHRLPPCWPKRDEVIYLLQAEAENAETLRRADR